MPLGDGTGPLGVGKLTGRCLGLCTTGTEPGTQNAFFSRFVRGLGFRCGLGRRNGYHGKRAIDWARFQEVGRTITFSEPSRERAVLKSESNELKRRMEKITKRLEELESKGQ